ncbi:hypothetical protein SAMN05444166_6924 [Singulisphaera sp. GP187]|nr:hypothetical protein SAMN05444166_6924 [Singulisphaera sp. GP187]
MHALIRLRRPDWWDRPRVAEPKDGHARSVELAMG